MRLFGIGTNRRARGVIGHIRRADGGAVIVDLAADIDIAEIAAIAQSVSDYCEMRGWGPGQFARAMSDLQMARRGLVPAGPGDGPVKQRNGG